MNDIKRAISDSLDWLEHNSRVPLDVADLAAFQRVSSWTGSQTLSTSN
jgi:hypothetical protein